MTPPPRPSTTPSTTDLEDSTEHSTAEAVGWVDHQVIVVGSAGRTLATPGGTNPIIVDGAHYHGWIRAIDDHGNLAWTRRLDGGREVYVRAVVALGGDLVIAGEQRAGDARAYNGWVARIATGGAERWRLDDLGAVGVTSLQAIAVRGDGTVIAGGTQHRKAWLVAVDRQGKLAWERDVAGLDEVTAVMAAGSDVVVVGVTGRTTTSAGTSRLIQVDASGAPRWITEAPERGQGELYAIAPVADGGVAVGKSVDNDGRHGAWIVRFAADGAIRASQVIPSAGSATARAVAATGDGGFIVAGTLSDAHGPRGRVWRFDAAGTALWQQAYGDGESRLLGVTATPDGGAVVVGTTQTPGSPLRPWIFGVDRQGQQRWTAR